MESQSTLFFSEHSYFEARGARHLFRPSALAPAFDISATEKGQLLAELPALAKRSALETIAFSIFAAVSLFYEAFSGQRIGSENIWLIFIGLAGVGFLGIYRRDRLISQILPGRKPDIPRKTLKTVLSESNPFAGSRATVSSLWIVRSVYVLLLVLFDAAMLGLLLSSAVSSAVFHSVSDPGSFGGLVDSAVFLGSIVCFNAVLGVLIVVLTIKIREARRRLRGAGGAAPDHAIDVSAMRKSYPGP